MLAKKKKKKKITQQTVENYNFPLIKVSNLAFQLSLTNFPIEN